MLAQLLTPVEELTRSAHVDEEDDDEEEDEVPGKRYMEMLMSCRANL